MSLSRRRAWTLALIATFTMAVSYVDRQTLAVLSPAVCSALGISDTQYGWLASAFSISYLVGAPLAGRLIDHIGSPRGLLGAVLIWSGVAALHSVVPGFAVLFALRIALGFAEAPSFPGAAQTVHRVLPPEDRARGLGVLFTGSSFGAMVAPPLATWIAASFGWRGAFIGTAIVGLIWVPIWYKFAFEKNAREALERREEAVREPSVPFSEVVRLPAVIRGVMLVLASAPALAFVLLWGAKYLVRHHHLTVLEAGAYLWLPPLLFDGGSVLFGDLASRRTKRLGPGVSHTVLVGCAAILQMTVVLMPYADGPWTAMVLGGLSMAGGGGLFALATADMLGRVPSRAVSTAGGVTAAAQSLAYIIANPLIGANVDQTQSFHPSLLMLGLWIIPGTLMWIFYRLPAPAPAPAPRS